MGRIARVASCHPEKPYYRISLCRRCWHIEKYGTCPNHPDNVARKSGLCVHCSNPEKKKKWAHKSKARYRIKALLMLGGRCVSCGESNLKVLQIDHSNNDGKNEKYRGAGIAPAIVLGNRETDGLQLLCGNCHHLKSWGTNPYWDDVETEIRNATQ